MSYKSILVHIDNSNRCAKRLELAIKLGTKFEASLVGLHVFSPYAPPGYIMAHMGAEVMEAQEKAATELLIRVKEAFCKQVSSSGLESEWHTAYDDLIYEMVLLARYADMVVISQSDPSDDSGTARDFPERLVLTVDRPVLILPSVGDFNTVGKHILVAWNASREAARAITNALPFLKLAESVCVMTVNPKGSGHDNIPSEGIVRYLARHGVRVETSDSCGIEIDVGNELLSRAADLSADLIVMGGYGHSRFKEWVLGGATRTILESMTIPVLMSH